MKAKTELLLYQCLWTADVLFRPTWRNFSGSFEEWAYRHGMLRQIQALGGRHPEKQWDREWDGKWRTVMFDLPETKRGLRNELRRQLKTGHFGGLQRSVWISPDPVGELSESVKNLAVESGVLFFFEGSACGGESNREIVHQAWNFEKIGRAMDVHRHHLEKLPQSREPGWQEQLLSWANEEKELWTRVMELDPLLPRELWPEGYQGEKNWENRKAALRRAGELASQDVTNL